MYWLCPSGLLLREVRPEPDDWLLAVPRLAELVREVVVRDDFSADLLCPDCGWPVVLLLDSFMTFKELSETLMLSASRRPEAMRLKASLYRISPPGCTV